MDAHNIVPVWVTSDRELSRAFMIRPQVQLIMWSSHLISPHIEKNLDQYLTPFPTVVTHPVSPGDVARPDWQGVYASLRWVW